MNDLPGGVLVAVEVAVGPAKIDGPIDPLAQLVVAGQRLSAPTLAAAAGSDDAAGRAADALAAAAGQARPIGSR